jgi:hypothetical protein
MASNRGSRLAGNLVLLTVSLAIALLLMEGAARLMKLRPFADINQLDTALGWRPRPNSQGTLAEEGLSHIRINSAGFRDREHAIAKPANTYRIAVLGDSYVFGLGVEREERFTEVVEQRLAGCPALAGKQPEVLNFGVSGYSPGQELIVAERHAMAYQPDLFVQAFFSGNDVGDSYKALNEGYLERPYFVYRNGNLVEDDSFRALLPPDPANANWFFHGLRSRSALLETFARGWGAFRSRKDLIQLKQIERDRRAGVPSGANLVMRPPKSADWSEGWRVVDGVLARTAMVLTQHGVGYLLVEIPNEIRANPDTAARSAFSARMGSALDYPTLHLNDVATANHIDFFPLAGTLLAAAESRHAALYGFDGANFGHWNRDGHRIAGEAIAARVCADLGRK